MSTSGYHILLTDPHLQGGGQVRYVTTLAAGLQALGHRVTLGCRKGSVLVEQNKGVVEILDDFQFRGGLRLRSWAKDIRLARRFIEKERPDIIHVNSSEDHWTMAAANWRSSTPSPLLRTRHNTYTVSSHLPNRILNKNLTDFQIVVCNTVCQDLARHRAFNATRLHAIHNGVDAELYQANPEIRNQARAEFGYKDDDIVCGIVGRLVPAKGHAFLFQALAELKDTQPNLHILAFGQGVLEEELRHSTERLGIASRVQFAGFRNDMDFCIQAFDIGAQPSIDCDTSSFSMKEQMAAGIPVIAADYGGLGEIIDHEVEGILVPTASISPLTAALEKLASDPILRKTMGERARQRVLNEFSQEVFVRRTADVYRRVVEEHLSKNKGHLS